MWLINNSGIPLYLLFMESFGFVMAAFIDLKPTARPASNDGRYQQLKKESCGYLTICCY